MSVNSKHSRWKSAGSECKAKTEVSLDLDIVESKSQKPNHGNDPKKIKKSVKMLGKKTSHCCRSLKVTFGVGGQKGALMASIKGAKKVLSLSQIVEPISTSHLPTSSRQLRLRHSDSLRSPCPQYFNALKSLQTYLKRKPEI